MSDLSKSPPGKRNLSLHHRSGVADWPFNIEVEEPITAEPLVLLLTDHPQIERDLMECLHPSGYTCKLIEEPAALWKMGFPSSPTCLLCSHPMGNGVTGFDVLDGIRQRDLLLPTLFVAAEWDISLVVNAMKSGADDFLTLPIESERLQRAVAQSLHNARQKWTKARAIAAAKARVATLDKREREVVKFVLKGFLNKEIAHQLDLALVTIKVYRARAMKKLGAGNAPEMVRIASLAGMCNE